MTVPQGAVILKNGPSYILGRYRYLTEESAKEFYTHEIFKIPFDEVWPNFFSFHLTKLNDMQKKDQPKSLFLESGFRVDLADVKRDLFIPWNFRDFLISYIIPTLGSFSDGFYCDLYSTDTHVFVDYPYQIIYINGEKIGGTPARKQNAPMMEELLKMYPDTVKYRGIIYAALEHLNQPLEILQFYHELVALRVFADYPEDLKDPVAAVRRRIAATLRYFHSARQKWCDALDLNFEVKTEFQEFKSITIPKDFDLDAAISELQGPDTLGK
jgi:hypothetical protein